MYPKKTNLERLISVLRDGQWHPGDELANKVSYRFGHTVYEARKKGYDIQIRKISQYRHEYKWLHSNTADSYCQNVLI